MNYYSFLQVVNVSGHTGFTGLLQLCLEYLGFDYYNEDGVRGFFVHISSYNEKKNSFRVCSSRRVSLFTDISLDRLSHSLLNLPQYLIAVE